MWRQLWFSTPPGVSVPPGPPVASGRNSPAMLFATSLDTCVAGEWSSMVDSTAPGPLAGLEDLILVPDDTFEVNLELFRQGGDYHLVRTRVPREE